jgi:hypothetical protein
MRSRVFFSLPHDVRRLLFAVTRPAYYHHLQRLRTGHTPGGFTFKDYDSRQCFFIHIPKTAGMSVRQALFGSQAANHSTARTVQILLSKREYDRCFKFAFVRNPWDRVFSAFSFLAKGGLHETDASFARTHLSSFRDFRDFVKRGLRVPAINGFYHFRPQLDFLLVPNDSRLQVNFVGLYENLSSDFAFIANRIGCPLATLGHANMSGSDAATGYLDVYDDECREIVREVYREDIDRLGYCFDNSSLGHQLASRAGLVLPQSQDS